MQVLCAGRRRGLQRRPGERPLQSLAAVRADGPDQHRRLEARLGDRPPQPQAIEFVSRDPRRLRDHHVVQIAEGRGREAPRGARHRAWRVQHRPIATLQEPADRFRRGGGEVWIADGVEHQVIGRQGGDLLLSRVLHVPDQPGVAVGGQQEAVGDVAGRATGEHQHGHPATGGRLEEQALAAIGLVEQGGGGVALAAPFENVGEGLAGHGLARCGAQSQPAVVLRSILDTDA